MKRVTFKNKLNGEYVICDNVRDVEVIDGVQYLIVHRQNSDRMFFMRKDALEQVNDKIKHLPL